jgi:hypothetical protein
MMMVVVVRTAVQMSTNPEFYIRAPRGTQPPFDSNVRRQ